MKSQVTKPDVQFVKQRQALKTYRKWRTENEDRPFEEFLSSHAMGETDLIAEVAIVDLMFMIREGYAVRVEDYTEAVPEIKQVREYWLDLIDAELCARSDHGEKIEPEELESRFPELGSELKELLAVHQIDLISTPAALVAGPTNSTSLGPFRVLVNDRSASSDVPYLNATHETTGSRCSLIGFPIESNSKPLKDLTQFVRRGAAFAHPLLQKIHDFGHSDQIDSLFYIAFEPAEGSLLSQQLSNPISESRAMPWMARLSGGALATWENQTPYINFAPDNILIDHDNQPKLMEPGVSDWLDLLAAGLWPNEKEIIQRLGYLLFSMLVGTEDISDLKAHVESMYPPPNLCELDSSITKRANCVFASCVHAKEARRYRSLVEVFEDLRDFESGRKLRAQKLNQRLFR